VQFELKIQLDQTLAALSKLDDEPALFLRLQCTTNISNYAQLSRKLHHLTDSSTLSIDGKVETISTSTAWQKKKLIETNTPGSLFSIPIDIESAFESDLPGTALVNYLDTLSWVYVDELAVAGLGTLEDIGIPAMLEDTYARIES